MVGLFLREERGAVTTDWVALTAGIVVLGMVVAYAVMGDSHAYLDQKFEVLNEDLEKQQDDLAKVARSINFNK